MRSYNDSIDTPWLHSPLSSYNTFNNLFLNKVGFNLKSRISALKTGRYDCCGMLYLGRLPKNQLFCSELLQ